MLKPYYQKQDINKAINPCVLSAYIIRSRTSARHSP